MEANTDRVYEIKQEYRRRLAELEEQEYRQAQEQESLWESRRMLEEEREALVAENQELRAFLSGSYRGRLKIRGDHRLSVQYAHKIRQLEDTVGKLQTGAALLSDAEIAKTETRGMADIREQIDRAAMTEIHGLFFLMMKLVVVVFLFICRGKIAAEEERQEGIVNQEKAECKAAVARIRQEIQTVQSELEGQHKLVASSEEQCRKLYQLAEEHKKEVDKLHQLQAELESRIHGLEEELQVQKSQVEAADKKCSEKDKQIQKDQKQIQAMQNEIQKEHQKYLEIEKTVRALRDQLKQAEQNVEKKERQIAEKTMQADQLSSHIQHLQMQLETMTGQIQAHKNMLEERQKTIDRKDAEMHQLNSQLQTVRGLLEDARNSLLRWRVAMIVSIVLVIVAVVAGGGL